MKRIFQHTTAAALALSAAFIVVSMEPVEAQVNCRAASSQAGYVNCMRRMQEIYREQGQAYDQIVNDLNRTERRIDNGMQYTPGYARNTWNTVRRGYYLLNPGQQSR